MISCPAPELKWAGAPTVGHTTSTESTILWAAHGASTSWIEYGKTPELGVRVDDYDGGLRPYGDVIHRVTLRGLEPGTLYFYRAFTRPIDFQNAYDIRPGDTFASEIGSFTTFDPNAPETSFVVWNDTHDNRETIVGLQRLSQQIPLDFVFLNGDVSDYIDDEADMVRLYVNPCGQPFVKDAPLLFARGNHDIRGRAARHLIKYVAVPDGRFYYAFRQGPVAAIVLDTGEDKPDDHPILAGLNSFGAYRTRQASWLEKEVQKPEFRDAPFRIVLCHIPLWCRDGDEDNACADGLAKWHALLEKAKVQAVVSGHTHDSVVLAPTKAHSYYQIIGGGPGIEAATQIRAHATKRQMTFTITNLDGRTLNAVVLSASIQDPGSATRFHDLDCGIESENPASREVFIPLLEEWTKLCKRHNVEYSIFWGTLLGQLRNQRIIPYDQDLDVVVGTSGLNTLYGLPGTEPGCVFNNELKDLPAWKDHEIRLVVRRDLDSLDGPRFDNLGRLTPVQIDACSFNGPLARLIIKLPAGSMGREYWHLDVDLFTDITRFNPYPARHEVDELPELEYRPLEGLQVSCLKHPLPYIKGYYGSDFMIPDHVSRDGQWVWRGHRRFTIGVVGNDDAHAVQSAVRALRLYHPDIADQTEILVVDNNPDGPHAEPLRLLMDSVPGSRYISNVGAMGTAVRDVIFREARGDFVVCIDCDVLIAPGALSRLYGYSDAHPDSNDLLQGPLIQPDMTTLATHLAPEWNAGRFGRVVAVPEGHGADIDSEPFDIPMQSLNVFACRRSAWPGSNPVFRGFGSEADYIHEKVRRRRGGRTLCLPFLRWMQRSDQAMDRRDLESSYDRIWNYIIGRRELDMTTKDVYAHFEQFLGVENAGRIIARVEAELPSASRLDVNPYDGELRLHHGTGDVFGAIWDEVSLGQQRTLLRRICDVAQRLDIKLYLYWGSLLGHIRDGGIISWDDDVDLALFDSSDLPRLNEALQTAGLKIWDMLSHVKICDASYQHTSRFQFTWPGVDIFSYSLDPEDIERDARTSQQPHWVLPQRDVILPGRPAEFEGAHLWQPEQPLAVLDKHYEGWRDFEESTSWSHVKEGAFRHYFRRPIVTDAAGHKIAVAYGPPALVGS